MTIGNDGKGGADTEWSADRKAISGRIDGKIQLDMPYACASEKEGFKTRKHPKLWKIELTRSIDQSAKHRDDILRTTNWTSWL